MVVTGARGGLGLLPAEWFVCGVKANKPATKFYDGKYVILAGF